MASSVPIVDFSAADINKSTVPDDALKELGTKIVDNFVSDGYCFIQHHGIDELLINKLLKVYGDFYDLPDDVKKAHTLTKGHYSGWLKMGAETVHPGMPVDVKESFNYCPSYATEGWPPVEGFEFTTKEAFDQCTSLAYRLCDALSLGLGQEKTFFRSKHSIGQPNSLVTMRSSFYPSVSPGSEPQPGQMRFGEHTDYGFITFFFLNEADGFEVKSVKKGFIPVQHVPGTVLLMPSDLLQRWTADKVKAAVHRVALPANDVPRRCVTFYLQPDNDCLVECLDGSQKYQPVTSLEHCLGKFDKTI